MRPVASVFADPPFPVEGFPGAPSFVGGVAAFIESASGGAASLLVLGLGLALAAFGGVPAGAPTPGVLSGFAGAGSFFCAAGAADFEPFGLGPFRNSLHL